MRSLARFAGTAALTVCLAFTLGCGRRDETKQNVSNALKQANLQRVDVDYDRDARIVHLRGKVDSLAERTKAEDVASATVGTSGRVLNELTVVGMNDKTADNMDGQIRDTLDKMVDNDPVLKERDINFDVNNGVVTVKGDVRSAEEKNRVGDLVKAAPGVKDMANALEVKAGKK